MSIGLSRIAVCITVPQGFVNDVSSINSPLNFLAFFCAVVNLVSVSAKRCGICP